MPVRARRGIEAPAILLVILLGVSVLLPLIAPAAAQATGSISPCGGPAPPVPGATVTLVAPPGPRGKAGRLPVDAPNEPDSARRARDRGYHGGRESHPLGRDLPAAHLGGAPSDRGVDGGRERADLRHGEPLPRTPSAIRARPEFHQLFPRFRCRGLALQPACGQHEPLTPHSRDRDRQLFPV